MKIPETNKDEVRKHRNELLRGLGQVSQIGFTMLACVLVGVFLGHFLDSRLDTSPWLLLLFSFLGMGAAFKSLFEIAKRM